ncbi:MAG: hypothetical protein P9E88_01760 [Candidatus Competibacter sp.]|jgi:hypothetical protein|nr:hypothetical protein [Candidatus Competibacter sp.]
MTIDFPYGLKPRFLTTEQVASHLNITVDIVRSLIEQGLLFSYAAIPSTPMIFIPNGKEKIMRKFISNPEAFPEFDFEKFTRVRSGIFRVSINAIISTAIKGSSFVDTVWSLTPFDCGHDDINENDPGWFGGQCYCLKPPVEITLSDIRASFRLVNTHRELDDTSRKIQILEEKENALQENKKGWPWGDYETELLRKLALAAKRFWVLYDPEDPTTAPTSTQVSQWLIQQGVASRVAEIMAQILRADGLPKGPRK